MFRRGIERQSPTQHSVPPAVTGQDETAARGSSATLDAGTKEVGGSFFVSHCLLNQNPRYLGGAICPGVVADALPE